MAEVQKIEFIESLKRLKLFFNNIKEYEPSQEILKTKNFIDIDLQQLDYRIFNQVNTQYLNSNEQKNFNKISGGTDRQKFEELDRNILEKILPNHNKDLPPDEEFLESGKKVNSEELREQHKTDQQWFEEATTAIRQGRKFQYLIHRQENLFFKNQIEKKEQIVMEDQQEINELKNQLKTIQKSIDERKQLAQNINDQIKRETEEGENQIMKKNQEIKQLKMEKEQTKSIYEQKMAEQEQQHDLIRHELYVLGQELSQQTQKNNMMYFFPMKVEEQQERIKRKKVELDLSKKIISETLSFMKMRVQETKKKHALVVEINNFVGKEIRIALDEEQEFYESSDRDQLKTPPFVNVKRLPRPGVVLEQQKTAIKNDF